MKLIEKAKKNGAIYEPDILSNGDTVKQLLARSRYVLYKNPTFWTESQQQRAALLFDRYPDLEQAHNLALELGSVYDNTADKLYGLTRLAKWYEKVRQSSFKVFNTISRSIQAHYKTIVNYFDNRGLLMLQQNYSMLKSRRSEDNLEEG